MFGKSLTSALLIGGACSQFAIAEEISLAPAPQQAISQIAFLQDPKDSGADVLKPQRVDGPSPRPVPNAEFELPNIGTQQPFNLPTPPNNFPLNGMNNPSTQSPPASNGTAPGIFWIEHLDGDPFGTSPYTSIGTNQFLFLDDEISLMVQGSGRISNNGEGGATAGVQLRNSFDSAVGPVVLGSGFYYDASQTPGGNVFHQGSLSGEILFPEWAIRINGYHPLGPSRHRVSTTAIPDNVAFNGNTIQSTTGAGFTNEEVGMRGLDFDVAVNLTDNGLEGFLGYYHFSGNVGGSTDGIKGGLRGLLGDQLGGNVTVSNDRLFGTSVFGGLTFYFDPFGNRSPANLSSRLTERVQRTTLSVVNNAVSQIPGNVVDLTTGGMVITVTHVDSAVGIGNGTGVAGDPFGSLTQADVSMNDIVYVHADSLFNNQSFAIADGQRLLGEGDGQVHFVQTDQLGMIPLPAGNGGVNRPVLISSPNAIALGSDTELSNFQFNADVGMPPLSSINASGINGIAFVNRVGIDGGLAGISLDTSPAGGVVLSEIVIQNSIEHGIVAAGVGGLAIDNTTINLADNNAIGIEYINAGGIFGVDNTFIEMNNAAMTIGIRVENSSAVDPLELFGMNNFVNQAANASQSQDFGGGFIGTIEINGGGGDDLP